MIKAISIALLSLLLAFNPAIAAAPMVITDVNNIPISPVNDIPPDATFVRATSGNQANATATATIPAVAAKTNYITGFDVTGGGATAGSLVVVTLSGIIGGSITYTLEVKTGATVGNTPLSIEFTKPIPASAVNTAIAVSCAALGAGSTNNVVNAYGYVK